MKVRAKEPGYYGSFRDTGVEFDIAGEEDLGKWMEVLEPAADEKPVKGKKAE